MKIIGIDPGLQKTGWGIIKREDNNLKYIASGVVHSNAKDELHVRLLELANQIKQVIALHKPDNSAIEITFSNVNSASSLKLGQARGALVLCLAQCGLEVFEYEPNKIKKSVVGAGKADKNQVQMMVQTLLPACRNKDGGLKEDEADALAIAICHANHF